MGQQVLQPMEKFQRKIQSLVTSKILKPSDSIWKVSLLFGEEWSFWKQELEAFGFTVQDSLADVLAVEVWEDEA